VGKNERERGRKTCGSVGGLCEKKNCPPRNATMWGDRVKGPCFSDESGVGALALSKYGTYDRRNIWDWTVLTRELFRQKGQKGVAFTGRLPT